MDSNTVLAAVSCNPETEVIYFECRWMAPSSISSYVYPTIKAEGLIEAKEPGNFLEELAEKPCIKKVPCGLLKLNEPILVV